MQAPGYSQSYNRYSYVWNNPLGMTDPTGYFGSAGGAADAAKTADEEVIVYGSAGEGGDFYGSRGGQHFALAGNNRAAENRNGARNNLGNQFRLSLDSLGVGNIGPITIDMGDAFASVRSSAEQKLKSLIVKLIDVLNAKGIDVKQIDFYTLELGFPVFIPGLGKVPFLDAVLEFNIDKSGNVYVGFGVSFGMSTPISGKLTGGKVYGWPSTPGSATKALLSGFELNANVGALLGGAYTISNLGVKGQHGVIGLEAGLMTPQLNFGANYSFDSGYDAPQSFVDSIFNQDK